MTETTNTEAVEQAAPAPGLTVGDLVLMAQVVQRASTAGVFRAEELKPVGDFYDRLIKFLESSGAIKRNDTPAEPAAPAA